MLEGPDGRIADPRLRFAFEHPALTGVAIAGAMIAFPLVSGVSLLALSLVTAAGQRGTRGPPAFLTVSRGQAALGQVPQTGQGSSFRRPVERPGAGMLPPGA